jgi:hypothetical protein
MKKLLLPIIVFLLVLVGAFYFYSIQANKIIGYKGIKLGMTMDEVIYAFGMPEVYKEKDGSSFENFPAKPSEDELKKNGFKSYKHWRYSGYKTENLTLERVDLVFNSENNLGQITCTNYLYDACSLAGINTQMSEKKVKDMLGKPSGEVISSDYTKGIIYKDKNLFIRLAKQKVISFTILDLKKNKVLYDEKPIIKP